MEYVCSDPKSFTASQPFQCLITSIMNGCARLRFEFIKYNNHHTLPFELRVVTISREGPYVSYQDGVCLKWSQEFHSISTLPMSHYKYNEWLCKVEIWIHHVKPSPHLNFCVVSGENFGSRPLRFTPRWSMSVLIQAIHSISTLSMSNCNCNGWLSKVEIWIKHV